MANVNWSPNKQFYLDTTTLSIYAPKDYPEDASVIGLPTYGLYGGPLYFAGSFDEPPPANPASKKTEPVDNVDALFLQHDLGQLPDAGLAFALADVSDELSDPEAIVYAGATTLFFALSSGTPEALPLIPGALENITAGLEELPQRDTVQLTRLLGEAVEVVTSDGTSNVLDAALDVLTDLFGLSSTTHPAELETDIFMFAADMANSNSDLLSEHVPAFVAELPESVQPDIILPEAGRHGLEHAKQHLPPHVLDDWLLA